MLKPAICYKEEIENALKEYFYTDDMMYYIGYTHDELIKIDDKQSNGKYQFAVVNDNKLIGYIGIYIDKYSSAVTGVNAFSFDRGNYIMGAELYTLLYHLIRHFHRVEFCAIEGNPAIKGYDEFLNDHLDMGNKITLRDVFKDIKGKYHNRYIYEFINPLK